MYAVFPRSDYYGGSAPASLHPRPPRIARIRSERRGAGSHVPTTNLWILRCHALPLTGQDDGIERLPIADRANSRGHQIRIKSSSGSACISTPLHPAIEWRRCKYRGFSRMIRCLTVDPSVARPAVDGRVRYISDRSAYSTQSSEHDRASRSPFSRAFPRLR